MISIFSERHTAAFSRVAEESGIDITCTNDYEMFVTHAAASPSQLTIQIDSMECARKFESVCSFVAKMLEVNAVKTMYIISPQNVVDILINFIGEDSPANIMIHTGVVNDAIIKESILFHVSESKDTFYSSGNEPKRVPFNGSSASKSSFEQFDNFINGILSYGQKPKDLTELVQSNKELTNSQERSSGVISSYLPKDSNGEVSYKQVEAAQKITDIVYDSVKTATASIAANDIVLNVLKEIEMSKQSFSGVVNKVTRMKDISESRDNIERELKVVREHRDATFKLISASNEQLEVLRTYLKSSGYEQEEVILALEGVKDVLPKSTIATVFSKVKESNELAHNASKSFVEGFNSINRIMSAVSTEFSKVCMGYEGVIDKYQTLVETLSNTAEVSIHVENQTEASTVRVIGTSRSGATNTAACLAMQATKSGARACVMDMKTSNPQLHFYRSKSIEFYDLLLAEVGEVERILEESFESSLLLTITNVMFNRVKVEFTDKEINERLKHILFILAKGNASTYVVLNRQDCQVLNFIKTLTVMEIIVTDPDVAHTSSLMKLVRMSQNDKRLIHRRIFVTRCDEISPKDFLLRCGVPLSAFKIIGVPSLPIPIYKINGLIYAYENNWGWQ